MQFKKRDGDNDAYENGILISALAHELGHWVIDNAGTQVFDGDSLPEYLGFRAKGEALGIVNSMIIGAEIEYSSELSVTLTGYDAVDSDLVSLYGEFQENHNLDMLINSLVGFIENNSLFISRVTEYWNEKINGGNEH